MRKFYGEFNANGYTIYEQGVTTGDPEYQAGNCGAWDINCGL
jgi:hypothetical protein